MHYLTIFQDIRVVDMKISGYLKLKLSPMLDLIEDFGWDLNFVSKHWGLQKKGTESFGFDRTLIMDASLSMLRYVTWQIFGNS